MSGGRSFRLRGKKSIPSATNPGGKYVLRKLRIFTSLAKRFSSVFVTTAWVKGQFQTTRMGANATPTAPTAVITKIQRQPRFLGDAVLKLNFSNFITNREQS